MTDREQRLVDALRHGTGQSPPPGLADSIKKDIPETISSNPGFFKRTQGWLIAATLVTMVGAGWLALELIRTEPSVPAAVFTERPEEQSRGTSVESLIDDSKSERVMAAPAGAPPAVEQEDESGQSRAEERPAGTTGTVESSSVSPPPPAAAELKAGTVPPRAGRATAPPPSPVILQNSTAIPEEDPAGVPSPPAASAPARQASRMSAAPERDTPEDRNQDSPRRERATEDEALTYDSIRKMIAGGQLPDPAAIDVDLLVNHFDYGDRAPWRRGNTSLFIEGGAAPFRPGRWRTVRIGIRSGGAAGVIGEEAELEVMFDPAAVSLYRRVGTPSASPAIDEPSRTIRLGTISAEYAQSFLFEVKLHTDIGLDQSVVRAELRYTAPADRRVELSRSLRVGHIAPTWSSSSMSLRSAILVGALAENLGEDSRRIDDLELLQLARELRDSSSADEAVVDLTRLVVETVRLQARSGPHH